MFNYNQEIGDEAIITTNEASTIIDDVNNPELFEAWYRKEFQEFAIKSHIKKQMEFKNIFNFVCLIEDPCILNLYDDCGFSGMPVFLNLKDQNNDYPKVANNLRVNKENSYRVNVSFQKTTWLDLWKAIDEVVKLNGNNHLVISHFEVHKAKGKDDFKYVKAVIREKANYIHAC